MRLLMFAGALALAAGAASAEEPYLDDRSSPQQLVRSLYNAISRKEYPRAWSYFAEKPAADLATYGEGYADTDSVLVRVGRVSEEGAAGTTHYALPVAIEARTADGDPQVYGGCYEFRLANPQIQGEDFAPLQIVRGDLQSSNRSIDDALPEKCGDGAQIDLSPYRQQRADALFRASFREACTALRDGSEVEAESWELPFNYASDAESEPKRYAWVFRYLCNRGAYNESHVFLIANEHDELSVLSFATPELDIRYADDESKQVDALYVKGFTAQTELVNSTFEAETSTLKSAAMWRGIGDASSSGTWAFRDGRFSLTHYEVDASYDGQINPEVVVDYQTGP